MKKILFTVSFLLIVTSGIIAQTCGIGCSLSPRISLKDVLTVELDALDQSVSIDISNHFGLPTGSVIATSNDLNIHANGNPVVAGISGGSTTWTFSGTSPVVITVLHGTNLADEGDQDGFIDEDGVGYTFEAPIPLPTDWSNGQIGNYYFVEAGSSGTDAGGGMLWTSMDFATEVTINTTNTNAYNNNYNIFLSACVGTCVFMCPSSLNICDDTDGTFICYDNTEDVPTIGTDLSVTGGWNGTCSVTDVVDTCARIDCTLFSSNSNPVSINGCAPLTQAVESCTPAPCPSYIELAGDCVAKGDVMICNYKLCYDNKSDIPTIGDEIYIDGYTVPGLVNSISDNCVIVFVQFNPDGSEGTPTVPLNVQGCPDIPFLVCPELMYCIAGDCTKDVLYNICYAAQDDMPVIGSTIIVDDVVGKITDISAEEKLCMVVRFEDIVLGPTFVVEGTGQNCIITPIELRAFNAIYNERSKAVDINFITATQFNVENIELERSFDNRDFTTIHTFENIMDTSQEIDYTFEDDRVSKASTIYYRLRTNDKDGSFEYSKFVTVSIKQNILDIKLFPNPTSDELNIDLPQDGRIQLFDIYGSIIMDIKVKEGQKSLDVSGLQEGMYMMKFITDTFERITKRLMIIKS